MVVVALPTAAVLPQAEGAPHPRPVASPKAGNLSFPGLRHLEENDPGGHKDLVAEGPTFRANHPVCWLPSLRVVRWASRPVVNEVVPAGLVVPVALQQQLLPQAVPLPQEEAPPEVAAQLLHQAPRMPHPRPAASPEARSPEFLRTPAPRGMRPRGPLQLRS
ncbi:hypothetical protein ISCGN_005729 [Ixodes scapularis]